MNRSVGMLLFCGLFFLLLLIPSPALGFSLSRISLVSNSPRKIELNALRAPYASQDIFVTKDNANHFSLDKPVYVPSRDWFVRAETIQTAARAAAAATGLTAGALLGSQLWRLAMSSTASRIAVPIRDDIRQRDEQLVLRGVRSLSARVQHACSQVQTKIADIIFGGGNPVDMSTWSTAALHSARELPGGYIKYKFALDSADSFLPLDVGQELVLSLVDKKDRVLKDNCFPVSKLGTLGSFEIVSPQIDADPTASRSAEEKFSHALQALQPGDEIALRGGRHRLIGSSPFLGSRKAGARSGKDQLDPISRVSVVAAGAGIVPATQLLRYSFDGAVSRGVNINNMPFGRPMGKTSAREGQLLWLNDRDGDFGCGSDIQNLEYRFGNKFSTHKFLESDLYSPDLVRNGSFRSSIVPYSPGSIAVICAPEHLVEQFRFLYRDLGYPVDSILVVMTS